MVRKKVFFNIEEVVDVLFELGITQRALAKSVGVTDASISGLLNQKNRTAIGVELHKRLYDFFAKSLSPERVQACFYRK